jgi:surface polysaccharide O-acyltransferase-like enzyme
MKALFLLLSTVAFVVTGYVLFTDVDLSLGVNEYIYMSLLLILMLICVVGILINAPLIIEEKKRVKKIVRKLSKAQAGNPEFSF